MNKFTARFEHDHGYSIAELEAASPAHALDMAISMSPYEYAFADTFDVETGEFHWIDVTDANGQVLLSWHCHRHRRLGFADAMYETLLRSITAIQLILDRDDVRASSTSELELLVVSIRALLTSIDQEARNA